MRALPKHATRPDKRVPQALQTPRWLRRVGISAAVLLLLLVGLLMYRPWSGSAEQPAPEPPGDEFASDRGGSAVPFDAKRAMGYLEAVCKIGPRISGTEGMKKQQDLLAKHFEDLGGRVTWQRFTAKQRGV